ncbi:MAG: DUF4384 domain-containing protein, partial [Gemmatimonadales bacterium]
MILPVVALVVQAVSAQPGDRPIRVWLGTSGPVAPGERVRAFVQTAVDGYLIVLRSRTDRRIEVLFPAAPTDDAFVPAGSYEVRRPDAGAAFAALEPPGTGLVIAALSPTRFRPDEFMRHAEWNPAALVASWSEADVEGALTDIVQRLLGDGYFSYDVVAYTVAAPRPVVPQASVAGSPGFDQCPNGGCVVAGVTVIIVPTVLVCDPFTAECQNLAFFPPTHQPPRPSVDPACDGPFVCSAPSNERVIALATRPRARAAVVPRRSELARVVIPQPTAPLPITPRRREVVPPPHSPPRQPTGREVRMVMARSRAGPAAPAAPQAPLTPPPSTPVAGLTGLVSDVPLGLVIPIRAAAVA